MIPSVQDFEIADAQTVRSTSKRVGYIGTLDFVKMHPRFVELGAAVPDSEIVFPVAGSGSDKILRRQAHEMGMTSRFEWLGYQENTHALLTSFDVFGYPLCPETYATTDLTLQQAMWNGIPPVILPYGGLPELVQHNETGMIVNETDYAQTVFELVRDTTTRARLGNNARAYARKHFRVEPHAATLHAVYETAMQHEKREHVWQGEFSDMRFVGASAMVESFGETAEPYRTSMLASDVDEIRTAEQKIARAPAVETSNGGGGILDYRRAYPDDAMLRLWSGLVLAQQGRFALAGAEFTAARTLGLNAERVEPYLQRVLQHQICFPENNE